MQSQGDGGQTYLCRRVRLLRFQNSNKLLVRERKLMGLFMQMKVGMKSVWWLEDRMTPSLRTGVGPAARLGLTRLTVHILEG